MCIDMRRRCLRKDLLALLFREVCDISGNIDERVPSFPPITYDSNLPVYKILRFGLQDVYLLKVCAKFEPGVMRRSVVSTTTKQETARAR